MEKEEFIEIDKKVLTNLKRQIDESQQILNKYLDENNKLQDLLKNIIQRQNKQMHDKFFQESSSNSSENDQDEQEVKKNDEQFILYKRQGFDFYNQTA